MKSLRTFYSIFTSIIFFVLCTVNAQPQQDFPEMNTSSLTNNYSGDTLHSNNTGFEGGLSIESYSPQSNDIT
jgi:hypothetical protein